MVEAGTGGDTSAFVSSRMDDAAHQRGNNILNEKSSGLGSPGSLHIFNRQNPDRTLKVSRQSDSSSYSPAPSPQFMGHLLRSKSHTSNKVVDADGRSTHSLPSKIHMFLEDLETPSSDLAETERRSYIDNFGAQTTANSPGNSLQSAVSIDPPRPAREGFEWVWFPTGYWAERKFLPDLHSVSLSGRRAKSQHMLPFGRTDSSTTITADETPTVSQSPADSQQTSKNSDSFSKIFKRKYNDSQENSDRNLSIKSTSTGRRLLKGVQQLSPIYPHFISPDGMPEGLYCKTKRGFDRVSGSHSKNGQTPVSTLQRGRTPTLASLTLEGATQLLEQERRQKATGLESSSTNDLGRRGFGLAPWHRKNSGTSLISVPDSVRILLMGRTPAQTPKPGTTYINETGQTFQRVEISEGGDPDFLPSEARRINTPPLSSGAPTGQARGFFFDFKAPPKKDSMESDFLKSLAVDAEHFIQNEEPKLPTSSSKTAKNWFDEDLDKKAKRQLARRVVRQPTPFEFDIPEHYPSSPLCPMNPLHPSGGTGICVYHGRRKSTSNNNINAGTPQ